MVRWPFGSVDVQSPVYAASIQATINNPSTVLKLSLTGDLALSLSLNSELTPGAILLVEVTSDTTARKVTFGTGFSSPVLFGVASKTFVHAFEYDGVSFVLMGAAVENVDSQAPAYAATLAVTVVSQKTILKPAQMTGAMTINLTLDPALKAGALLLLQASSDTTARDITFGTGFTSPVLAGVISKTKNQTFIFDGTNFLPLGASLQIN